jgi:hypothetical protein
MKMETPIKTESGWRYALLAILIFFLLAMDVLSMFVGKLIDGRSLSDPEMWSTHWYATVGMFLCSVIIWSVSVALVLLWIKRKGVFDSLFQEKVDLRAGLVFILGVFILVVLSWLESHGSKDVFPALVNEYRGFEHRYPGYGVPVTAFQYLYYLLESAMVVLILALWQGAGELWTRLTNVPWGGLGLTLTWGLAHFASHPQGAPMVVLTALLFGLVFIGVRKSIYPSLALIWLAFVL